MSLTLVIGGTRSGKSAYAEALAEATGLPVRYVATADGSDVTMRARIEAHSDAAAPRLDDGGGGTGPRGGGVGRRTANACSSTGWVRGSPAVFTRPGRSPTPSGCPASAGRCSPSSTGERRS